MLGTRNLCTRCLAGVHVQSDTRSAASVKTPFLSFSLSTPVEYEVKTCVLQMMKGTEMSIDMLRPTHQTTLGLFYQPPSPSPSCSEHPSHVRLLLVGSCGVEGVRLGTDQCPFNDEPHFPEHHRSVELSTSSFGQFRRQALEHTDCLWTWSTSQLNVKADLVSVSALLRFFSFPLCGSVSSRSCRSLHVRQSCWPPDCDVQPSQLVRTWKRGNHVNPCSATLVFSHCGATLSMSSVAPTLRSCLARLSRTPSWIRVLHGLL